MLEAITSPLKALIPPSRATPLATEPQAIPQVMNVDEETRPEAKEASPHEEDPAFAASGEDVKPNKEEELLNEPQRQLPTPSPSTDSTFSSARAGPSSSASSSFAKDVLKRSTSRVSSRGTAGDQDETKGPDGKEYQLCGMYYSAGITPKNPSLSASIARTATESGGSTSRSRRSTTVSYSWRTIEPSKSTILPPPIHYGLMLLGEAPETYHKLEDADTDAGEDSEAEDEDEGPECGFELPHDILRDFYYAEGAVVRGKGGQMDEPMEDVEKRETSRKPAPYRHIQTNFYVDRKPDKANAAAVCMCKPPNDENQFGCLQDCINRMMQYCCDPKLCPCGAQCSNLPLNKRPTVEEGKNGLKVIWTGNRGFGLKTMVPIRKGDLVIEYRGEVISRDESYRRVVNEYKDRSDYYFLEYDTFEVLDAGQKGNSSRFINHSCGPNCEVVRWRLASVEEYQVGIFAKRDIRPGEELTYNYGWQNFVDLADPHMDKKGVASTSASPGNSRKKNKEAEAAANDIARQRCFCGSPLCSGYLGGKPKDESTVAGRGKSGKGKGKAVEKASPIKTKPAKEKKKEPVKLEWAKARVVLEARTGRRIEEPEPEVERAEEGSRKKKFKAAISGLVRASSLRGAAAKAKEKLTGQR